MGRLHTYFDKDATDVQRGYVTVICEVYRDINDVHPAVINVGYGNVDFYPANMKKWFVEDTWTSCISRAIKTLSPSSSIPSKEDMARVEMYNSMPIATVEMKVKESRDPWSFGAAVESTATQILSGTTPDAAPNCDHGARLWKEGESARGKYAGWVCSEKSKERQCKAQWLTMSADGRWV